MNPPKIGGFRTMGFLHLKGMQPETFMSIQHQLRIPGEPAPAPIREPVEPQDAPDMPVQEPEPEDPNLI